MLQWYLPLQHHRPRRDAPSVRVATSEAVAWVDVSPHPPKKLAYCRVMICRGGVWVVGWGLIVGVWSGVGRCWVELVVGCFGGGGGWCFGGVGSGEGKFGGRRRFEGLGWSWAWMEEDWCGDRGGGKKIGGVSEVVLLLCCVDFVTQQRSELIVEFCFWWGMKLPFFIFLLCCSYNTFESLL